MGIKRHKPEEIVTKLRQVEVLAGQGMARVDAIRQINITEETYYSWPKAIRWHGNGSDQRVGTAPEGKLSTSPNLRHRKLEFSVTMSTGGCNEEVTIYRDHIKLNTLAMRKQNHYANRVSQLN